ncbi:hypothetical protein [Chitinolyticbacter albus]|uniref:hypothetical protein n=1 Tax=Chitinolyticbacter albus TaxID=2961951 RepID=UPI00210A365D|nr:hypothetical protein [Chitinolyticbacter albus]
MEILERDGVETLYVHGATVSELVGFLNPQVPWVWILGHMPNTRFEWWETTQPINRSGTPITAEFRLVSYDLLLPTSRFLDLSPTFEGHGISLIQSNKRMANALDIARLPEDKLVKILRSNGAFLRIELPHAVETSQVQCFEKGYLASVIAPNNSFKGTPNGAP